MKESLLLLLLCLTACGGGVSDHLVLRGLIPGAKDSTKVQLYPDGSYLTIVGYVVNGRFELRDTLDAPVCCLLRFFNGREVCEARLFAENGVVEFEAEHIDSLTLGYQKYDVQYERNYRIRGTASTEAYARYLQQTLAQRTLVRELERQSEESALAADARRYWREREKLEQMSREFIQGESNLAVNLCVAEQLKREPFTYDLAYAEELGELFAAKRDTCAALRKFRDYVEEVKMLAIGKKLEDVEIQTPGGRRVQLLEQLNPVGYTVIDFWASWCGSCRASFPALRKVYERFGERVRFISVAVSDREESWQKALREEQMPWAQFRGEDSLTKMLNKSYKITSIPKFVVISPRGEIVYCGSRCGALEMKLENLLK